MSHVNTRHPSHVLKDESFVEPLLQLWLYHPKSPNFARRRLGDPEGIKNRGGAGPPQRGTWPLPERSIARATLENTLHFRTWGELRKMVSREIADEVFPLPDIEPERNTTSTVGNRQQRNVAPSLRGQQKGCPQVHQETPRSLSKC